MTITQTSEPSPRRPLRLWPGVVFAIVLVLGRYVVPLIAPEVEISSLPLALVGIFAGMAASLGIILWWLLFSRAPWLDRLAAIVLMIAAVVALWPLVHESIRGGNMGNMLWIYSVPILTLAIVIWAVATRGFAAGPRRLSLVAAVALAAVPFLLIRTAGVSGAGAELHWRWTPTPEDRLLAQARQEPEALPPAPAAVEVLKEPAGSKPEAVPGTSAGTATATASAPEGGVSRPGTPSSAVPAAGPGVAATAGTTAPAAIDPGATPANRPDLGDRTAKGVEGPGMSDPKNTGVEWPGFRGPHRDGVVRDVRIRTDWSASPPVEMWRRPIGPGWSSFAISGDLVYTQEQRGDDEMVSAYNLKTGEPVWRHKDAIRFWESNAGAGPRGTPTVHGGRVYTVGAKGLVNALDGVTGASVWSRNAVTDTGKTIPDWGIASSPLAIDDLLIVAVAGQLIAYDTATGKQRWLGEAGGGGYSSPHLTTIDGITQVVLQRGGRTISVAPADGALLWEHKAEPATSIVQPALTAAGVLIAPADAMGGLGLRRLDVARKTDGWTVEERWRSRGLKPYFSDYVVHEGHAYGFDGSIMSCINLEDGARKWKGGRYGSGQLVLLADQDLLLVVSEEGELALVKATSDQFTEVARFKAIEGKTWNHPVVVGDVLLVRNGEEMAAFRLGREKR